MTSRSLQQLVVASHNEGKVREIRDLLRPFGVKTISASELNLPEPEETGTTFIANAELKALASARASGLPALADDSGLAVDVLGGDPGIYSARWAEMPDGSGRNFDYAMAGIYEEMRAKNKTRTVQGKAELSDARFVCALSIAFPDGHVQSYEGIVLGNIVWPPRGDKGFGYDPIFKAKGDSVTFAQLEPSEKHAKSHRADAFSKFIGDWFTDAG